MHFWLDTSAMAKRYIAEKGSRELHRLLGERDTVVHVGQLVRTELASALARRVRDGMLALSDAQAAMRTYLAHQRRTYRLAPLTESMQREAERLIFIHQLRAADSLHVASALLIGLDVRLAGGEFAFLTADHRQATAAAAEGLEVRLLA